MGSGEFDLIENCFKGRGGSSKPFTRLGIGDDASIHRPAPGMELVVSTDTSVESVHWPQDLPLSLAADRAVCAAISDLAAMGAEPVCAWLNVMAKDGEAVRAIGEGATAALARHDVELAGGDTCRSPVNALSISVAGELPEGTAMRRDFANTSDRLWLAGRLGWHALALNRWLAGERGEDILNDLRVKPLLDVGRQLRRLGVRCCIDVSDGLLQDAGHLAVCSGLAIDIDLENIPDWSPLSSRAGEAAALQAIAHGGEDYALLFTAPENLNLPDGLAVEIGRCRPGEGVRLLQKGEMVDVKRKGFDHFG